MKITRTWLTESWMLGLAVCIVSIGVGCSPSEPVSRAAAPLPTPTPPPPPTGEPEVLATVDGDPVTLADFDENARDQIASFEAQYFRQRQTAILKATEQAVFERLVEQEAQRRGIEKDALLEEIGGGPNVSDEEVRAWYDDNGDRVGGRPYESVSSQIRAYLAQTRSLEAQKAFLEKFEDKVSFHVGPYRANIETEGFPSVGPADAPITLVEFSDFECPYCGQFYRTLERVKSEYSGQVRIVFRQFPLSIHPNAPKAAEASLCAHDQGKFWEMHNLLFENQRSLDVSALKQKAQRLGLDQTAFDQCLDSGKYTGRVDRDLRDGTIAGVTGTPSLFVNGIPTPSGAHPYEAVAAFIDEELARLD